MEFQAGYLKKAGMFFPVYVQMFSFTSIILFYTSKKKSSEFQVIASMGASVIKIEMTLVKVSGISLGF